MEEVYIWGKGKFYEKNKELIHNTYSVVGFFDNDDKKEGTTAFNKTVKVLGGRKILVMVYSFFDVVKQLLDAGVSANDVILGINLFQCYPFDAYRIEQGSFVISKKIVFHFSDFEIDILSNEDISKVNLLSRRLRERKENRIEETWLDKIPYTPLNRDFGASRGTTIARYYIDKFLENNEPFITGTVMEIGDNQYTVKYGKHHIENSLVLNYTDSPNTIKGDLQTGEGLVENSLDCFILTQVLDHIYDLKSACRNIVKALKPGKTALITVSGIGQIARTDMDLYGEYWFFTDLTIRKLFEEIEQVKSVEIQTYGNLRSAIAKLVAVSADEMKKEDLDYFDQDYQVLIAAKVTKREE